MDEKRETDLEEKERMEAEARLVQQTDNGPRPEDGEQPEDDLNEAGSERTDLV